MLIACVTSCGDDRAALRERLQRETPRAPSAPPRPAPPPEPPAGIRLGAIEGEVTLGGVPAHVGAPIRSRTRLVLGDRARVTVEMPGGTRVDLARHAVVRLSELADDTLILLQGEAHVSVAADRDGSAAPVRIVTPSLTAEMHAGQFVLLVNGPGSTWLAGLEGEAEVSTGAAGEDGTLASVTLVAGKSVTVEARQDALGRPVAGPATVVAAREVADRQDALPPTDPFVLRSYLRTYAGQVDGVLAAYDAAERSGGGQGLEPLRRLVLTRGERLFALEEHAILGSAWATGDPYAARRARLREVLLR